MATMIPEANRATAARSMAAAWVLGRRQLADADHEIALLIEDCSGRSRAQQWAFPEWVWPESAWQRFEQLLRRRADGEPLAYLRGRQGFWSMELEVDPATLIPRAETERLVELALERLPVGQRRTVLDLGTGSGAIALALATERPHCLLWAVDRSPAALAVAARNVERLAAANLQLRCSDWFSALTAQRFDLIVSNPPYIAAADPHLQRGDLPFEPAAALASGEDGLDAIRQIIAAAPDHLHAGGWLLLEHGQQQHAEVRALLLARGFNEVFSADDLEQRPRVSGGRWPH